jgi:hypothetical protein
MSWTHAQASELAAALPCLLCHSEAGSVPAHFPHHRGMGGRRVGWWNPDKWVPLCRECHDLIDARLGIGGQTGYEAWVEARLKLADLRTRYWLPRWDTGTGGPQ